ncbi:MAG: 3',5'-cyclic-nucleotide phosphodiesterase [Bacteroidota bacterium]|nr:3',5'-cyclic-nucleotide phosphodiesterase [Bacteroidota bacterium]
MKRKWIYSFAFLIFIFTHINAQKQTPVFKVIPLGTEGGLNESNLSAYMVAPVASNNFVCLDAGTLYTGINKAIANGLFHKTATEIIRQNIKGYCISHPHFDHVAGLLINSPSDTNKIIYATKFCLDRIEQYEFTWQTWANFGDAGDKPTLNKYHYAELKEDTEVPIAGTDMFVTAFLLSHGNPYQSTAFLVRKDSSYLLYFGDTGADTIEHSQHLQHVWQTIAPLVMKHQLKAIFLECSYPNEQPEKQLFGHLTPKLLMEEMKRLSILCNNYSIKNVPLVITHIKPEANNERKIMEQVNAGNILHLKIAFPQQGKLLLF